MVKINIIRSLSDLLGEVRDHLNQTKL